MVDSVGRSHGEVLSMSRFNPQGFGKTQAARPNAAEAKVENERYQVFRTRLERIAAAVARSGDETLAEELEDLNQRVEDRETTLEEGLAELQDHEHTIRARLKR
jgi:DNA repair exonuclease SbcCD ATPase subunit